ncbi:Pcl2 cyclin [Candida orthopsilosis Co 90-125]|uniref:Pcl2 cyclin n=1 Tax=Candida orthopsilosis (strain 90-125) TaxID=1136231 RepID=H8WX58_CANO9|nr:Pcl2 cyclin [Candida orthopsilosis Co 90-125]CCG21363.1 Pcl2 cyclin [Candida orthopsilosis Co 90-125]
MSDREALKIFSRQPVNLDMINFLVSTTNSIIQVKPQQPQQLPSPASYSSSSSSMSSTSEIISINPPITLTQFIKNLIKYSNVQTPTLMATLVYLNKLRNYLPANAVGMETTRHRIFLSALIVAAKSLNDSSPLNKHWTKYTDGLLTLQEINLAERELISILNWNINITQEELIYTLQPFLIGIKSYLLQQQEVESMQRIKYYRLTQKRSNNSLMSSLGSSSRSSSTSSTPVSSTSLSSSLSSTSSNYSLHSHGGGVSTSSSIASNLSQYEANVSPLHYNYSNKPNSKLPLSSTSENSLNSLRPSTQIQNQQQQQQYPHPQIPISKSAKFGQKDKNQYLAPIIKKKRSMMSLLTSSGKVVA